MSFGVVDNDETATERRTYGPTFVVLFRLLSAHKQLSLYPRGRWGGLGNMVKHETTLFKWEKKGKNFTDNKKSDYYVPRARAEE